MRKKNGHLPNVVIIGAPKCGTTSLHYYLNLHPQVIMSRQKELNFFIEEKNWKKGIKWYRKQFNGEADVFGEASPLYSNCIQYKKVPQKMQRLIPDARLIYVLRDPIQRILSHYTHAYARGLEKRSLQEALHPLDDSNPYLAFSKYALQLDAYMFYFPINRILILTAEELLKKRDLVMKSVFEFIGVNGQFSSPSFQRLKNTVQEINYQSRFAQRLAKLMENDLIRIIPETMRGRLAKSAFSPFKRRISKPNLDRDSRDKIKKYIMLDLQRLMEITQRRFEEWDL